MVMPFLFTLVFNISYRWHMLNFIVSCFFAPVVLFFRFEFLDLRLMDFIDQDGRGPVLERV